MQITISIVELVMFSSPDEMKCNPGNNTAISRISLRCIQAT